MSHFSVAVITKDPPSEAVLVPVLQPWHEYECTGVKDQYVVEVDITDEVLECFGRSVAAVRLADGTYLSRYDTKLYTRPPKDRLDRPGFELPSGAVEVELPAEQAREVGLGVATMRDAAIEERGEDGFVERDGSFFRLTNPNKKWDWWVIGGRWTGTLLLKSGATTGIVGRPGLMTPPASAGAYDGARVDEIDLEAMAKVERGFRRERINKIIAESALTEAEIEEACRLSKSSHETWLKLPEPRPRGPAHGDWLIETHGEAGRRLRALNHATYHEPPALGDDQTVADWIAASPALVTYAVVKDGQWFGRGDMGWFGMSSNECDDWDGTFARLLAETPGDAFLTIVDCHI